MASCKGTLAPWMASLTFGGPDLKTVYLGSLMGHTLPCFRSPVAGLPMAQTIWYIPTGLDIWNQKIARAPGHYARGFQMPDGPPSSLVSLLPLFLSYSPTVITSLPWRTKAQSAARPHW